MGSGCGVLCRRFQGLPADRNGYTETIPVCFPDDAVQILSASRESPLCFKDVNSVVTARMTERKGVPTKASTSAESR